MCKRAGLLVGFDYGSKRALVTDADCDSWKCPECSKRMKSDWVLRAQIGVRQYLADGRAVDFVTITSNEKLTNFAQTEYVWRQAWPTLYAAIKRKNKELQFMVIPEKHKDGRMHVHALWTAGVSQRWLKDNGRKRGLGYKSEVEHITSVDKATRYVTKYVGKDLGEDVPPKFRRVRVSQKWPAIPAPVSETSNLKWEYVNGNGALEVIYRECQDKGLSLIDLKTGEYFDDVDLGTIVAEF